MSPLASERDQNIRIQSGTDDVVVKIANTNESPVVCEMQAAVLIHLAIVAPELAVPRVRRTADGATLGSWASATSAHVVRCVSYLQGTPLGELAPGSVAPGHIGRFLGALSRGLASFGHPAAHRGEFLWDLDQAQECRSLVTHIAAPDDRLLVERAFAQHAERVAPLLVGLRKAVIHGDANDYNVIVGPDGQIGLIDFGDMVFASQVNELAIALAYALMGAPDVVATASAMIAGYVAEFPLHEVEASMLFDLVGARLAMSVSISSRRSAEHPDNEYLLISQRPALALLRRLDAMRPDFLQVAARVAAGFPAIADHDRIVGWMASPDCRPASVLGLDLVRSGRMLVGLSPGSAGLEFGNDPYAYQAWLDHQIAERHATFAVGAYLEDRNVYRTAAFDSDGPERRSVHIGLDLFVPPDTPAQAMFDGRVFSVIDNASPQDYGPTVILEHTAGPGGPPFWVLYGHLSLATMTTVTPGQQVRGGEVVGYIGTPDVNGGWAPHLHLQLMTNLLGNYSGNFEGAGEPSRMAIWKAICPDPNLLVRLTPESLTHPTAVDSADSDGAADRTTLPRNPAASLRDGLTSVAEFPPNGPSSDSVPESIERLIERRATVLGASLSISYRRKLHIVRGEGSYLIDADGRSYLDCVNNVAHIGHSHPRVVEAMHRQAARLNTNTRYLHGQILDYAERLGGLFPDPLSVVYFVNSGSEANELAMRLARTATDRYDMITMDWAYHGNTNDVIEISPYKFNRPGGRGRAPHVQVAELPDPYRGGFGNDGPAYATSVAEAIAAARRHDDQGPAAFIAESVSGCGGQVELAEGYLSAAFAHARSAGALCIVDEVQAGFGRVGDAMWAFERHAVVPDIVTLGKPMGNGHPLGAVVTTPAIAAAFDNGMEYFNTFGGNPVSCAVGMAVLDVIADEGLLPRAAATGDYLLRRLRTLQAAHSTVGNVRGRGLFIGIDLVTDPVSKAPATRLAADVANALRERGVLISTDGPHDNVIKIKPPMTFGQPEADILCDELAIAFTELS
jgi:4-aminobutyrate aminotransferase-like enzyme/Ser/Thr protein kinase RdoA (MazF antagonist)/murein DD-endopeptidase MepM/ murein hydrolase activator NlpD